MALKGFLPPNSQNIGSALIKASTRKVVIKKSSDKKSSPMGALTKSFIKSDIISPQKKNGALVKTKNEDSEIEEQIKRVEVKVIKLQELFKDRFTYNKIKDKKEKRNKKNEEKIKREKDLKNNKKPNKFNIGKFSSLMPKTGILDAITNFLLYTVLGYLNNRFDIIPKLIGLIPMLTKTMDFVINIGGFLLEGLVTFIDFGYGLVDKTRGFIKALGGDGAAKAFDKFLSTLNILFNLALVAALVNAKGGFGGKPGKGGKPRGRPGTGGRPKVTTSGGKGAGRPDIRNPLRNKPPVTTSGGGKQGRPNVRNPLRGKPPVTGSGGRGGLKLPNIFKGLPKVSPGAFAKGAGTLGVGIALDMGVNALFDSLDQSRQEKIIDKIKTFPPEKRKKIISKMQEDLKKETDYQVSPLHAIDKVISMGGETMSEKKSNDFRAIIEGLGEIPKHALGGLIGKANAGLSMMGGMMSLPPVPKLSLPNLTPQSIGNSITGGFKSLFALFGLGGDKKDEPPTYLKGLIKLGNKVKDVPLIGGAMYAAIQLAMGSKVDRRVLGFVGGQLTNFSNLDAFKGISSSASKLSSALQFASGGQIPSTVVSLSPSDNRKSIISLSNYLDREIQSIELELDKEKKDPEDPTQSPGGDGGGGGGGHSSEGGIVGNGISKAVSVSKKLIADLGITPAQASGIVGNFLYESAGMNPGEREGEPYGIPEKPWPLGTIGRGYGWAQWTNSAPGDRLDKFLKSYGGEKGKIATDDDNYRFLMKELKGSESLTGKGMVTGTYFPKDDPQAASDWFRQNWERAGIPADEKRRKETLMVFDKIKGLSRDKAKEEVAKSGGKIYTESTSSKPGSEGSLGGTGNFIQGNSGASRGIHFHIGPGSQEKGTILQSKYNADARSTAKQVIKHFLGKKSMYDGRSGRSYTSGSDAEIKAAQEAHTSSGSQGGIDIQVGGAYYPGAKVPFPLNTQSMKFRPNGFGVSADISGSNSFVAHGYKDEMGKVASQDGGLGNLYGSAQGGGYIGKNPKVYGGINESASYEQSGMMIMIQPMIIEKSSPSMSGGGNMDKITFAGSGSVNSVNPAAERG